MRNWSACTATLQRDPYYVVPEKPAHQYHVGLQVYITDAPGIYRRGTIIRANTWLGFTPAYTVCMAHGNIVHLCVPESDIKSRGQVYGIVA